MTDLAGQVALVTGGGGGLGSAICQSLAEAGVIVLPADLRLEAARVVAQQVLESGGCAQAIEIDLCDADQSVIALDTVVQQYGRLDVLVNCAGIDVTVPVEELTIEQWDRIVAVNLRAPFVLSRCALPVMKRRARGHIVNVISTAAKRAWSNASAYHATKWGLLGLSHALHVEARPHGVKVTAIVAGGMRTPFILDRFPDTPPEVLQDPRNVADTIRFVLGQPTETVIPEVMVLPMRETSWP